MRRSASMEDPFRDLGQVGIASSIAGGAKPRSSCYADITQRDVTAQEKITRRYASRVTFARFPTDAVTSHDLESAAMARP